MWNIVKRKCSEFIREIIDIKEIIDIRKKIDIREIIDCTSFHALTGADFTKPFCRKSEIQSQEKLLKSQKIQILCHQ